VQPIMNHVRKEQDHASQRIVRSSWVVAVYMNNDHVYCRLWFALYFMCDQIGRPIYISMGLYLYSLIKKYIKVASTVIYPWRCGVTASHWHSNHPNAYDSMSGILNQGQCLRFHLLVLSNHSKCHENEQSSDIEAHKWKVEHDTTTVGPINPYWYLSFLFLRIQIKL